jgi:hypothetical protein
MIEPEKNVPGLGGGVAATASAWVSVLRYSLALGFGGIVVPLIDEGKNLFVGSDN